MLPSSKNVLENVLNSKFSFKLDVNCKSLLAIGQEYICAGLENGELCIFSATKFQFICRYKVLEGAIIYLEEFTIKDVSGTNDEGNTASSNTFPIIMVQGKEGELAFVKYNIESNSFQTLLKWKEPNIVGFTKVSTNSEIWKPNATQIKGSNMSFNIHKNIFSDLNQIKLFYPDNDEQKVDLYKPSGDKAKKEGAFIPPPQRGGREVSMCCLKYFAFENEEKVFEFIFTAEENSRIGIVSLSSTNFSSSKFKELYQHAKQTYSYCMEPYQLAKEGDNLNLGLIIGLNLEEALILSINMLNLKFNKRKVLSTSLVSLSSSIKPGLNNVVVFRDGKYILASTLDSKFKICRTKDFKQIVSLNIHESYVNDILIVELSGGKELLCSCSEDNDFCILDLSSLKKNQ